MAVIDDVVVVSVLFWSKWISPSSLVRWHKSRYVKWIKRIFLRFGTTRWSTTHNWNMRPHGKVDIWAQSKLSSKMIPLLAAVKTKHSHLIHEDTLLILLQGHLISCCGTPKNHNGIASIPKHSHTGSGGARDRMIRASRPVGTPATEPSR